MPNKYQGAKILKQTNLLSLIEVGDNSFWVKTSDLVLPEPKQRLRLAAAKMPIRLGFGKSQHSRWHVKRGIVSDKCRFCTTAA